MKTFELTEEQRNDLYFKNFDGTIKIDGFVFSDYKGVIQQIKHCLFRHIKTGLL